MTFALTTKTERLLAQKNIEPQLVLTIEGLPYYYGALHVKTMGRFDEGHLFDSGDFFDTPIKDPNSRNFISLENPTTNNVTQQLLQDKGGTSSISSFVIKLVNKNNELGETFQIGNEIADILSRRAKVFLGFNGSTFPEDFILIFSGIIDEFSQDSGSAVVSIAHPDVIKRQEIFIKTTTNLTSPIFNEVEVDSIEEFDTDDVDPDVDFTITNALFFRNINIETLTGLVVGNTFDISESGISGNNKTVTVVEIGSVTNGTYIKVAETLTTERPSPAKISISNSILNVTSTEGYILPSDILLSYVRVGDEIMQVDSKTNTTFSVVRGQLETAESNHAAGDEVESFYVLEAPPIEMALKLMLSDGSQSFNGETLVYSINKYSVTDYVANSLFFIDLNPESDLGLVVGDEIQITLSSIPGNNITTTIEAFGLLNGAYYITVSDDLSDELPSTAQIACRSQFNVLNEGLGMLPEEVDVAGHLEEDFLYGIAFPTLEIYIRDTLNGKEFLDREIYFPTGLYSIPRKARSSCKLSTPPLSSQKVLTLNSDSIINLSDLKVKRSVHKNFYNAVIYKFKENELEEKFLAGRITYSADSDTRIKFGTKSMTIEAKGFRNTVAHRSYIDRQSDKFLDRFKFATEYIEGVKVMFADGFNYEVGDIIKFGGRDVQLVDYATGQKFYKVRLMEIINKSFNLKTGEIKFDLLSTSYSLDGRYAVISMSSFVETQTDLTRLKLKSSFGSVFSLERKKYEGYEGLEFRLRSEDYTYDETFTYVGQDPSNENQIIVSGLSVLADEDYIIEIPDYDDSSVDIQTDFKIEYCFLNPTLEVTAVTDASSFQTDTSKLLVGSIIRLHDEDYSNESQEVKVQSIVGSTVTTNEPLNYTPSIGDQIELCGFVDGGLPYRIV